MGFIDNFADAVENVAKKAGKKASELADASKNAVECAALNERLSRQYEKLGRLVADNTVISASAKISGSEFEDVFSKIDELKAELDKKKSKKNKCSCGKVLCSDMQYCPQCGRKNDIN